MCIDSALHSPLGTAEEAFWFHKLDLSSWKLCQFFARVDLCVHIIYIHTNEIKYSKELQVRSDPCNEDDVAREDRYVKEVIVNLATLISHLA